MAALRGNVNPMNGTTIAALMIVGLALMLAPGASATASSTTDVTTEPLIQPICGPLTRPVCEFVDCVLTQPILSCI